MCGIAGYWGKGDEQILSQMVQSIRHRGPDAQPVFVKDDVGFAHARLSIIDLRSAANQPMFTVDRSLMITFNGEIYNYLQLKEELHKTGKYTFATTSDTEVLIYAYQEFGIDMLKKIHGMFAFAIYDFNKKELLLARDRMGKKPLHYTVVDGTLVFASELKAIIKHPSVKRTLNVDALNEYLTFDYVPTTSSIYKNIHKLEAASYLLFKNGEISRKEAYWQVSFEPLDVSFNDAKEHLDTLLDAAVRDRLMSDVPLGVFLSGGLDSSSVAYYAQKNSAQKIKTFSIGFSEKSYDESDYARLVAKQLNTEHYEQYLSAGESLALIPEIFDKLDEPFADPSIIPTYFLSKFTRQHVTVALGGDGSDELLAGYPTFISEQYAGLMHSMPGFVLKMMTQFAEMLPASDQNISFDFKVKQFMKGFQSKTEYTHSLWLGSFTPADKRMLFTSDALNTISNGDGLGCVNRYLNEIPQADYFSRILYAYYKTYLQDDILVKVDRASMMNSLEVRAPFLDTRIVEYLSRLRKDYKIEGSNVKKLLKEVMRGKIPDDIIDRPKKGFGIPVSLWLRNELKGLCDDLLSEQKIKSGGLFDYAYINRIKQEHMSGKKNHRKLLWNLIVFQLWNGNGEFH